MRAEIRTDGAAQNRTIVVQGAIMVALVLMNIIVARYWGAGVRGELAAGTVLASVAAYVGGWGAHDVVVWAAAQGVPESEWAGWCRFSVLTAALAGVLAGIASHVLLHWNPLFGIGVAMFCIVMQMVRVQSQAFLARNQLVYFDWARLAVLSGGPLALISLAVLHSGVHPIYGILTGQLAAVIIVAQYWNQISPLGRLRLPALRAIRLGLASVGGGLIQSSLSRTDILIVALILGSAQAGVYAISLAASEGVLTGASALAFHALRNGAWEASTAGLLKKAIVITTLMAVPGLAALHYLARTVLGAEFAGADRTFVWLLPGTVAMAIIKVRWAAAIGRGAPMVSTVAMLTGLVLQTSLDLAFVGKYGVDGAAAVSSSAYLVAAAVAILGSKSWRGWRIPRWPIGVKAPGR